MKYFLIFFLAISFIFVNCQSQNKAKQDSKVAVRLDSAANKPDIEFIPPYIETPLTEEQFFTSQISIRNNSSDTLEILSVKPSCGCSMATVLKSRIPPHEEGGLYLGVNLKGLYDDKSIVEYNIETNKKHLCYRVKFISPK